MSCARTRQVLDAWIDDELDPSTRDEIGGHLAQCPACSGLRAERSALRDAIRQIPSDVAPAAFKSAVRRALVDQTGTARSRRQGPGWLAAASFACVAAVLGGLATYAWMSTLRIDAPRGQAIVSHVAAMALAEGKAERLVQVAASDHHVVKPWFQGKLDFAPPVRDLAANGFEMLGARLDRVGDRQAAVVVYRIRNHPIDLYVWRASGEDVLPVQVTIDRGFSVATWSQRGLGFAAISDVDVRDLDRFARLVEAP
jgi:anti-sigma factor RsiW